MPGFAGREEGVQRAELSQLQPRWCEIPFLPPDDRSTLREKEGKGRFKPETWQSSALPRLPPPGGPAAASWVDAGSGRAAGPGPDLKALAPQGPR